MINPYEVFPQLKTPRLILRHLQLSDGAALYKLFADPKTTRFYDLPTFHDPLEGDALAERFIQRYQKRIGLRWALTYKTEPHTLIGTCGYNIWIQPSHRAVLGFDLSSHYWRQGLMSEALQAILNFGFETMQLNRVEALIFPQNIAAQRLLLKTLFRSEGILRQYEFIKGRFVDMAMYARLAND